MKKIALARSRPASAATDRSPDYFVEKDALRFAGTHLFLDMWGANHLDDAAVIEQAMCAAATSAGAEVLHSHFHRFEASGGVTGVVVLAESHMSIHTWPERGFAAVDIFMCGECDPYLAVPTLRDALTPVSMQLGEQRRGIDL